MTTSRRVFRGILLFAAVLVGGCDRAVDQPSGTSPRAKKVAIVYIAPHELINQIIVEFKQSLLTGFGGEGLEFVEMHANGDTTQFASTVRAAISQRPDVLVPITTPIAQIAIREAPPTLPVCFLGITDPVGAGLVVALDRPERCTGVSDLAPFAATLDFVKRLIPGVKSIGMPYSPDEQPAVFARDQVTALASAIGIRLDARPVTNKDDLPSLLRALAQANDALIIGSDNGMFEAAPLIVKIALDARKPVFAGDSTSIKAGAIGGYTVDYGDVGRQGAQSVARLLRGDGVGAVPIVVLRNGVLELNATSARKLEITLPQEMLEEAHSIVGQ